MYIPMLEAISEMLSSSKPTSPGTAPVGSTTHKAPSSEKVECAKIMLDKIIEGMKEEEEPGNMQDIMGIHPELLGNLPHPNPPKPAEKSKPESKRVPKPDEVGIEVNNGLITKIINAKDNTMIQLDGKAYPWRKVIGMSFTEGKVL